MGLNLWKPEPKRRAGIVRPAVVPGVPLARYTNTELGVRIARQSNLPQQQPGVAWARLMHTANRPEKDVARDAVLRLLTPEAFPTLSVFTFPASEWRFENALLAMREGSGSPRRTQIVSVERDIAIYRAACHNIPLSGMKRVRVFDAPPFATDCVSTARIQRFFRCEFEEYAAGANGVMGQGVRVFKAAWLDFNGQLSPRRLNAIVRFWTRQVDSLLVVTLMNARTGPYITAAAGAYGGVERLIASRLDGAECTDVLHYGDTVPMIQATYRRVSGEAEMWQHVREARTA